MISSGSVGVAFRSATLADAALIVALVESAYRGEASRAGWTTEADLLDGQRTDREEVEGLLADARVEIVLASTSAEVVGSVCLRIDPDGVAHVGMFAIRPTSAGAGFGSALLAEVERRARARGARRAAMTVIEQRRELIAWYARRGWHDTGEREPFPYGNPRFGLPKRPDLRFVVLEKSLEPPHATR